MSILRAFALHLRITEERRLNQFVIAIHGELLQEGVSELKRVCDPVRGKLLLDLTNLTTADAEGLKTIRNLEAEGAKIVGASRYIQLLLEQEGGSNRQRVEEL